MRALDWLEVTVRTLASLLWRVVVRLLGLRPRVTTFPACGPVDWCW
jgi:hypothetical protein